MAIEWRRVTWYSQLAAIILFLAVFALGFKLGERSERGAKESVVVGGHRSKQKRPGTAGARPFLLAYISIYANICI